MKQVKDNQTMELEMPGAKRGRGRPPTFSAMTNAERQKAYRDRLRETGIPKASKAKEELDYTSQIWKESEAMAADLSQAQEKARRLEAALQTAQARIFSLEKEQALMIAERAAAFKAADQAKEALMRVNTGTTKTDKWEAYVLELEAQRKQDWARLATYEESAERSRLQREAYETKIKQLEANIKRNASRKKKNTEPM